MELDPTCWLGMMWSLVVFFLKLLRGVGIPWDAFLWLAVGDFPVTFSLKNLSCNKETGELEILRHFLNWKLM